MLHDTTLKSTDNYVIIWYCCDFCDRYPIVWSIMPLIRNMICVQETVHNTSQNETWWQTDRNKQM